MPAEYENNFKVQKHRPTNPESSRPWQRILKATHTSPNLNSSLSHSLNTAPMSQESDLPSTPPYVDPDEVMGLTVPPETPAPSSSSCIQVASPNPKYTFQGTTLTIPDVTSPPVVTPFRKPPTAQSLAELLAVTPSKRPSTNYNVLQPKRPSTQPLPKHKTSREAILDARDLIILASHLETDRAEQSKLLDLLQIFREYTEKGTVHYASSILASQVASLENVSKRIDNKTKNQKPTQPTQPAQHTPMPQQHAHQQGSKTSYAQIVSSQNQAAGNQDWTTVQKKNKHQAQNQGIQSLKLRQLVLTRTFQTPINPLQIRDAINHAFAQKGIQHKVIASVSLSKANQNIILTTTQSFTGQYLLDQQAIWDSECAFDKAQLNQSWFKVAIHGIPIDTDLSSVPSEIALYNDGLKVIGDPYWLTSAEKRQSQKAGSIVVAFTSEKEASFCIRNRVYIAGISARVEKVYSTPVNAQCRQCQGFGHLQNRCRNQTKCQLCGEGHPTIQHLCNICQTEGKKCVHTVPKCANCREAHTADAKDCEVRLAIQHRLSPTPSL